MDRMEHALLQVRKCNNTLAKASKKKRGVELFFTLSELLQKVLLSETQLQQNPQSEAIRHILSNGQTGLVDTMQ